MRAETTRTAIDGVVLVALQAFEDLRGSFTELYRREWLRGGGEALQANLSRSRPGVLRGLHFHGRQQDYWCVVSGRAFVALFDLREGSPTRHARIEMRIDADEGRIGLVVPPGVAHGFYAETEVLLLYLVDAYFTGEDEHGLAWDDPALGIAWPDREPILSERDRANPRLADIVDPPSM